MGRSVCGLELNFGGKDLVHGKGLTNCAPCVQRIFLWDVGWWGVSGFRRTKMDVGNCFRRRVLVWGKGFFGN